MLILKPVQGRWRRSIAMPVPLVHVLQTTQRRVHVHGKDQRAEDDATAHDDRVAVLMYDAAAIPIQARLLSCRCNALGSVCGWMASDIRAALLTGPASPGRDVPMLHVATVA